MSRVWTYDGDCALENGHWVYRWSVELVREGSDLFASCRRQSVKNLRSSSPGHGRDDRYLLSTSEDEGIKVIYQLGIHAPSTPLQHVIHPGVRISRHNELCEIGKL